MSVVKEWFCGEHGDFESSHAICPQFGCASKEVIRVFKTPPKIRSGMTTRTDAGLRRTAESYNIDLRTASEGESSKKNNRAAEMIWGLDNAQKKLGMPDPAALLHRPTSYQVKDTDTGKLKTWTDKYGGMQEAGAIVGNTELFASRVEKTISKDEAKLKKQLTPP